MAKRIITDENEARRQVESAGRAGKTLTEWAREHEIDGRSLRSWPRKLGLTELGRPRLVELVPRPGVQEAASYALVIQGLRFEFGEEASASMIQRVVGALRSC